VIKKFLQNIIQKPEHERNKWALGLTVFFSVLIFGSFILYKGYLNFGSPAGGQMANAAYANSVPTPIESTKETFGAAFDEIRTQYQKFTDSVSSVLVPFFTGIEVYQKK